MVGSEDWHRLAVLSTYEPVETWLIRLRLHGRVGLARQRDMPYKSLAGLVRNPERRLGRSL
jgi:hypothetical protein